MEKPLVSVLITCYNRERYIKQAIESVLNSSYSNFELIVVDDRSSDGSVKIAKDFAAIDSRVSVYINEKNLGDYPNRNRAASYAKGKYLKYVDADDLIYPWGLELMVNMMEKFPDAGWGLCSLIPDTSNIFPFQLSPKDSYLYHYNGPGLFHKAPLSSIIKKDAFEAVGGFSGKQHLGDFEMWHLLALKFSMVAMPQGITWYRHHDDQQNTQNKTDVRIPFKYQIAGLHFFQNEERIPLSESEKQKIISQYKKRIRSVILKQFKKGKVLVGCELIKRAKVSDYDFKKIPL